LPSRYDWKAIRPDGVDVVVGVELGIGVGVTVGVGLGVTIGVPVGVTVGTGASVVNASLVPGSVGS
jgi:hypothetical protein